MKNFGIISKELDIEKFRIVALLAIRNEELYLERCLEHYYQQGIEVCIIDNDSTDNSLNIALQFIGRGVFRIERQEYKGYFDLCEQLNIKEKLASEIHADWFIHCDADEIRQAPAHYTNLYQGILAASIAGYNAINFDEFVFIPLGENESHENKDFTNSMRHYYFFEPSLLRRVNAWKKLNSPIDLVNSGGHTVAFSGRKIFTENFILRHYIGLSASHLNSKYSKRIFSETEIKDYGWHKARKSWQQGKLILPHANKLKILDIKNPYFDKLYPVNKHMFNFVLDNKDGI